MSEAQVDLTSCDTEPIHIIGSIQPVGALIAASKQTLEVKGRERRGMRDLGNRRIRR